MTAFTAKQLLPEWGVFFGELLGRGFLSDFSRHLKKLLAYNSFVTALNVVFRRLPVIRLELLAHELGVGFLPHGIARVLLVVQYFQNSLLIPCYSSRRRYLFFSERESYLSSTGAIDIHIEYPANYFSLRGVNDKVSRFFVLSVSIRHPCVSESAVRHFPLYAPADVP